ncbi:YjbQ family protein [bacterium]|nr:YjbQ family protein [candidate division CSSED10-310 bacterium]
MIVHTAEIHIQTKGHGHAVDITSDVQKIITESGLINGIAVVFVPGATAGLTTIEFESGAVKDLQLAIDRMAPETISYHHNLKWHDGNGHSHVRAALIGPDITIPVKGNRLILGTWQQILLLDFDNKSRHRCVVTQLLGE